MSSKAETNEQRKIACILRTIKEGETIPGINKNTRYRFVGIDKYDSHGKAPEFDGASVVILESEKRKRRFIKLFVEVLVCFAKDESGYLSYGRLPPSFIMKYRGGRGPKVPNASEYVSHYKSSARYIHRNSKE